MSSSSYTFVKKIGQGSYGEVWLVDDYAKKKCVLKKISMSNASEKEKNAARLECQLLKQLIHPNIVQYRDSFEESGTLYIAMAYCEGGDLYSKLKEQKGKSLSERQITEWFIQIVMALAYMHERNILHRDLKTQNIFLAKSSVIKVGDLGIAKQLDNKNSMANTLIGTPYYMSPELFNKKPYNFKSDIWSLGCVTYEMATLKHAFNAKNYNALSYKIIMGQMPSMPSIYSRDLIALIESMLSNKPDKRPSTNRILREPYIQQHIQNFLDNVKRSNPTLSQLKRAPVYHRRNRADSSGPKIRSNDTSTIEDSPKMMSRRMLLENRSFARKSSHSLTRSPKERNANDDNDLVLSFFKSPSSIICQPFEMENKRKTVLENEIEKVDIEFECPSKSSINSEPVEIKPSQISAQIHRKDSKDDGEREKHGGQTIIDDSARSRVREQSRDKGLKTMSISLSVAGKGDDEAGKCNSAIDLKGAKGADRNRGINASADDSDVILPELKKKPEATRVEIIHVMEKMNEALDISKEQRFTGVKNNLLCPTKRCYDSVNGPEEDREETQQRTKMLDMTFWNLRKEVVKDLGLKKLDDAYKILEDMTLNNEMDLKKLLGKDDYEKFADKIVCLKMIKDGREKD